MRRSWGEWMAIACMMASLCLACSGEKADSSAHPSKSKAKISSPPVQMAQTKGRGADEAGAAKPPPAPDRREGAAQPPAPATPSTPAERGAGPATAASTPPPEVPFTPQLVKALTQINMLIDGSGSMNTPVEV
ncbi:MAG: hypothetical protein HY543_03790, partial [Deltaproteobacteria bacterium]|nr:hypothetical protein [Deltaproteobacteria bacterium]